MWGWMCTAMSRGIAQRMRRQLGRGGPRKSWSSRLDHIYFELDTRAVRGIWDHHTAAWELKLTSVQLLCDGGLHVATEVTAGERFLCANFPDFFWGGGGSRQGGHLWDRY